MREFVTPHVMHLMSISFVSFSLEVFVQKNANFSPKALTKERSKPSSKYCIYLVCGLPKFEAFLLVENLKYEFNWGNTGVMRSKAGL